MIKGIYTVAMALAFSAWQPASAHQVDGNRESVDLLKRQTLIDAPGKNAVLVTVTYAPGQVSVPHFHPGSVLAYVLDGEVVSQLEGQAPVIYKAGQSWYEPPRAKHLISKNASATKPAKLLVWLLIGEGDKTTIPLAQ